MSDQIPDNMLEAYSKKVNSAIAGLRSNQIKLQNAVMALQEQADGFRVSVANIQDGKGSMSEIVQESDRIALQVKSLRQNLDNQIVELKSLIEETPGRISLEVSNGVLGGEASIVLKVDGEQVGEPGTIDLTGVVTFSDLSTPGQTVIDAGNIKTGTVTADDFNINNKLMYLGVDNSSYVSNSMKLNAWGDLTLTGQHDLLLQSWVGGIEMNCPCDISLESNNGNIVLQANDGQVKFSPFIRVDSNYLYGANEGDTAFAYVYLGKPDRPWRAFYATNINGELASSSDREKKHDIFYDIPETYEAVFRALKPALFRYNDGSSGRTHMGFIAQDVLEAVENAGLTDMDFAAYIQDTTEAGDGSRYLRYTEFVPMNTMMIQKLMGRVEALEKRVCELEGENDG